MDTYGHLFPGQEADAVASVRELMVTRPAALQATGTYDTQRTPTDEIAVSKAQRKAQHTWCELASGRVAIGCDAETSETEPPTDLNALPVEDLCDDLHAVASPCSTTPGWNRTSNLRIRRRNWTLWKWRQTRDFSANRQIAKCSETPRNAPNGCRTTGCASLTRC